MCVFLTKVVLRSKPCQHFVSYIGPSHRSSCIIRHYLSDYSAYFEKETSESLPEKKTCSQIKIKIHYFRESLSFLVGESRGWVALSNIISSRPRQDESRCTETGTYISQAWHNRQFYPD
ncbi:hypothetical protein Plhal304r1_c041g0119041 [Plasmopara halstedii]